MGFTICDASDIRKRSRRSTDRIRADIIGFLGTGAGSAYFNLGDYETDAKELARSARDIAKRDGLPVDVIKRGETVYMRVDEDRVGIWRRDFLRKQMESRSADSFIGID